MSNQQTDPITPLDPQQTATQEAQAAREGYIHRTLVGLDIFVNVLTGGHPDETISSRAARAAQKGKWWGVALSAGLDLIQSDHGARAIAGDAERAKKVLKIENSSGEINSKE